MKFVETPLSGAYVIEVTPFADERGLFARTFCKEEFKQINHSDEFLQFNHSVTRLKGSIRGMHYQMPPFSEVKLIRCVRGRVFDVIIDIRQGSPTCLQYFALELSEEKMNSIYVPRGFAHGFQTLEDNSQLIYHHTAIYKPGYENAIRFDDPLINIGWPLKPTAISSKDQSYPLLTNSFKGIIL
jgi:dTDP-4-dehydrorhamnose 3,5-epimerase